jgi:hypothetical protein
LGDERADFFVGSEEHGVEEGGEGGTCVHSGFGFGFIVFFREAVEMGCVEGEQN